MSSSTARPARPILVLKTGDALADVKAVHQDFDVWIARELGRPLSALATVEVHLGQPLPDASEVSGVVVTGSPAMVTDAADWSEESARWLREIVRGDRLPVLGICYGHQLLAHALGGRVARNPRGREMGTFEIRFTASPNRLAPLFEPGPIPGHLSHLESVVALPPEAEVLAETALEPNCAVAFGPRQWGVQFHPEFDAPIMRGYIESRRSVLIEEGFDPDRLLAAVEPTPAASRVLERFGAFADASI
jgi:GMP synthase (glutamine-hydrolysing)